MAKKKISKGVKRRVTLIIGPISIGIFCLTLITVLSYAYRINKLSNTKKELEERLAYLQESAENMSDEIVKLKDPEYIAKYARENYYYTKNEPPCHYKFLIFRNNYTSFYFAVFFISLFLMRNSVSILLKYFFYRRKT